MQVGSKWSLFKKLLVLAAVVGVFWQWAARDFEAYRHRAIPFLMYHSIGVVPGWEDDVCIPEELFAGQLKYLSDNGYEVITADDARQRLLKGEDVYKKVVFTFDDGYFNNYTAAFPMLQEYGYHASFYAIGKMVDTPDYMTFAQMKEMHDAGMEIGSHTMSHDPLTIIADKYLPWEVYEPYNMFSRKMGFGIAGIAFPNGALDKRVLTEVKKYPVYKYALSGKMGCNTKEIVEKTPFALRRMGIYDHGQGVSALAHRLSKAYLVGYLESKGLPINWLYRVTVPKIVATSKTARS
jgi:hypothetical protein